MNNKLEAEGMISTKGNRKFLSWEETLVECVDLLFLSSLEAAQIPFSIGQLR